MVALTSALRQIRRHPRLAFAAAACIALGAAATAAVVTLVHAALLRPLPFPDADRLVRIWFREDGGGNPRVSVSIPDLADLATLQSFDAMLGTARVRAIADLGGRTERLRGEAVPPEYFETLAIATPMGRALGPADSAPEAPAAMVISHGMWLARFGAAADVVGRSVRTAAATYTIVGVTAPGFAGSVEDDQVEFWIPLARYEPVRYTTDRLSRYAWAIARLRGGVTLDAARGEAAALSARLKQTHGAIYDRLSLDVEPMGENWRGGLRRGGWLLLGAAGLLLVVASVNVAGLLLTRVVDRAREFAVRTSLGGRRVDLIAQLLAEALIIVVAGGVLGIALAGPLLRAFLTLSPVALPSYLRVETDPLALGVALAVIAIIGLAAGVWPAVTGSRVDPIDALRGGGRGSVGARGERRWGSALVAIETALTLVLLVMGGLLLRSWQALETTTLGYRVDGIARLAVTLSADDARTGDDVRAFYDRLRLELAAQPGVEAIGLVSPTLPPWDPDHMRLHVAEIQTPNDRGLDVGIHAIDDQVLDTLEIPLVAGRAVRSGDRRVALVSRSMADRLGGPAAAIDREIRLASPMPMEDPLAGAYRVVGVVGDVAYDGLGEQETRRYIRYGDPTDARAARLDVYVPLDEMPVRQVSIGVRVNGDAAAAIDPLRRAINAMAPASAVHWTGTMTDELALEYAPSRFYAVLIVAFSTSALALTGVGLFAVLTHGVSRRTPEIGLRAAMGATPLAAARLVFASGLLPLAGGAIAGLALALAGTRVLASQLYGTTALDGLAFIGATGALVLVALVASALPARRAARLDPLTALRQHD